MKSRIIYIQSQEQGPSKLITFTWRRDLLKVLTICWHFFLKFWLEPYEVCSEHNQTLLCVFPLHKSVLESLFWNMLQWLWRIPRYHQCCQNGVLSALISILGNEKITGIFDTMSIFSNGTHNIFYTWKNN